MRVLAPFLLAVFALPLRAVPSTGVVTVTPITVLIGTPTQVTVTASISDANLIPASVNLLQLNADGTTTILGVMHDDGLNGDEFAADGVFTYEATFSVPTARELRFQVSAAFKGVLQRVKSPFTIVFVQPANAADLTISSLIIALKAGNVTGALQWFVPSQNNTSVLQNLTSDGMAALARALGTATLLSSGADVRTYQANWIEADGSATPVTLDFAPNSVGQWVISNW